MGKGRFPLSKLLIVLLVVGTVFSYAMFQGGFVSWFLFYSVLVICILSLSILLLPLKKITIERNINQNRFLANEDALVKIEVSRVFFHPFSYIKVIDHPPESLKRSIVEGSQALFFFSFKRRFSFMYPLVDLPRGEHNFSHIEVVVGDLFGFFERKRTYTVETSFVVFPKFQNLDHWNVGSVGNQEKSISFSKSIDSELSLSGVRKYIPGDRLTTIDWKHSARQSELMTKQFSQSEDNDCLIIFNTYLDHKGKDTFEKQVELGASIINYFNNRKGTIGFFSIGETVQWIPKTIQLNAFMEMFNVLAKIDYEKKRFVVPEKMPEVRPEDSWLVITSSLSNEFTDWLLHYQSQINNIVVCWIFNEEHTKEEEKNRISLRSKQIRVYSFTEDHFLNEIGEPDYAKV